MSDVIYSSYAGLIPIQNLSQTRQIMNYATKAIVIVSRDGLVYSVPSTPCLPSLPHYRKIIVYDTYELPVDQKQKLENMFHMGMADETNHRLKALYAAYQTNQETVERLSTPYIKFTVATTIPYKFLAENRDGEIYVKGIDLVISSKSISATSKHPALETDSFSTNLLGGSSLMIDIDYISNSAQPHYRYMRFNNKTLKIESTNRPGFSEGIYLRVSVKNGDAYDVSSIVLDTLEAQKTLGIYRTYEEAELHGDSKEANAAMLEQLRLELEASKIATQQAKENAEQISHIRALEKAQAEKDLLEAKHSAEEASLRRKDIYAERDYVRSDKESSFKTTITLFGGAIALATLISKVV